MSQLEDRLREALDHAMSVRGEELLGAAHRGVRRRRTRRAVGASLTAIVAVAVVVAGVTLASGDRPHTGPVAPSTPMPSRPEPVRPSPAFAMSATSSGDALYVVLLPCAVADLPEARRGSTQPPSCARGEGPSTLWRYQSGSWVEQGPLPDGVAGILLGPDGRTGVGVDWWERVRGRLPLTRDGGRSWTELELPVDGFSEVFLTSTHVIVVKHGGGWYSQPIGSDAWRGADPPDAGDPGFEYVPFVVGDRLVAEVLGDQMDSDNHYWISSDAGQSWDGPRRFPGVHSSIFGSTTSGLVLQCVAAYHKPCGQYLSTDLTTWQKLDVPEDMTPLGGTTFLRSGDRLIDPTDGHTVCRLGAGPDEGWWDWTAAGGEMFALSYEVYTADGRVIDPNRPRGQRASTVTRTLMVSRDDCATWEPLIE